MLTNKDIRVENGNIVINGDKYPLDGQSPAAIMAIVEDNSDTTPTENSTAPVTSAGIKTYVDTAIGDLTQTGLTGATVAAQLETVGDQIIGLQTSKLTLVESKATSSGGSLTFDATLQDDTMYLIVMSAPVTATTRSMKCSIIRASDTKTNEISFGNSEFEVTVSNLKLTITNSSILYGIRASLIKLE